MKIFKRNITLESFLFIICLIFFSFWVFTGLGKNALIDWDEAIYGSVAEDMVIKGHWLYPTWNNQPYLLKPPLYMWLSAGLMSVFGISEWTVRFWSSIFGLAGIVVVFLLAKKMFNTGTAAISAIIISTTFHYIYFSRIAMIDVPASVLMVISLFLALKGEKNPKYYILSSFFLGLATMVKGLLSVLIIPSLLLVLLTDRKNRRLRLRYLLLSLATFSIVVLPWHLLMLAKYREQFINVYLGFNIVQRLVGSVQNQNDNLWVYIAVIKNSFRIWFPLLLLTLPYCLYRIIKRKDIPILILAIYGLITFTVFTIAKSNLIWYMIPIYAPLAILMGNFLDNLVSFLLKKVNLENQKFIAIIYLTLMVVSFTYVYIKRDKILTKDFNKDVVSLIKFENQLDPQNQKTLVISDVGEPVSYFYTRGRYYRPSSMASYINDMREGEIAIVDDSLLQSSDQKFQILARSGSYVLVAPLD